MSLGSSRQAVAAFAVAFLTATLLPAQRVVVDAGVSQAGWFSPDDWGPSLGIQARLFGGGRVHAIGAARGLFGLDTPGLGVSRKARLGTVSLGVEGRVAEFGKSNLFAALSIAQSYQWSRYTFDDPANARFGTSDRGFTWTRALVGLRLQVPMSTKFGLSLRAEVQPRFGELKSLNPNFALGFTY